jgi:hypothetical protein
MLQGAIADRVAVGVVDPLEVIDVDHQRRDLRGRSAIVGGADARGGLVEGEPIVESGERVVYRLLVEPRPFEVADPAQHLTFHTDLDEIGDLLKGGATRLVEFGSVEEFEHGDGDHAT